MPIAVTNTFHCPRTSGSSSSGARIGLTAIVSPIATPAHMSLRFDQQHEERHFAEQHAAVDVGEDQRVGDGLGQNMASSRIGAAMELNPRSNSRSSRYQRDHDGDRVER